MLFCWLSFVVISNTFFPWTIILIISGLLHHPSRSSPAMGLYKLIYCLWYLLRSIIYPFIPSRFLKKNVSEEIVLITGGGFGLGRLLAQRFSDLGSTVVIWDVNKENMKRTEEIISSSGGTCHAYYCDVSKPSHVYETAEKVRCEVGNPSIIVLNAGIVNGKKILDLTDEAITRCFAVNTLSHFWIIKAFLPYLMKQNRGHVISIDSVSSYYGTFKLTDYSAAKAASHRLQDALSSELKYSGYDGIRFSSIMPYFMATGMFSGSTSQYFPVMDPVYVADRCMDAILLNKAVVFIPRIFNILCVGTLMVPYKAFFAFHEAIFGGEMMSDFKGRGEDPDLLQSSQHSKLLNGNYETYHPTHEKREESSKTTLTNPSVISSGSVWHLNFYFSLSSGVMKKGLSLSVECNCDSHHHLIYIQKKWKKVVEKRKSMGSKERFISRRHTLIQWSEIIILFFS